MTDPMMQEIIRAAVALCRKLHEYQDDGLDVPGETYALEAALERAGVSLPDPSLRGPNRGRS